MPPLPSRNSRNWLYLLRNRTRLWLALLRQPATPRHVKVLMIGCLLYLLLPIDLIPDTIPLLGLCDDLALVGLVLRYIERFITDELRRSVLSDRR